MDQVLKGWPVRAVLALVLSGCAVDVDSGAAEESNARVASSSFALTASKLVDVVDTSVYSLKAPADWSDQGVQFVRGASNDADGIGNLLFSDLTNLVWFGTTGAVNAIKQDYPNSGSTFLARGAAVYKWGLFGDSKIADTGGPVSKFLATDASRVYWSDQSGIAKANKSGGGFSRILSTTGAALYGLEGSQLYFLRYLSSEVQIRKIKTDGTANTLLFSQPNTTLQGLSWDSSFFYWIEQLSNESWRLRRMPKSGGSPTTLRTTTNVLSQPRPRNGGLYWAEIFADQSGSALMARSSSGTITTLRTINGGIVFDLYALTEEIFWLQITPSRHRIELWIGL